VTDAELRALVRDAVTRHLAPPPSSARASSAPTGEPPPVLAVGAAPQLAPRTGSPWQQHTSHHLYVSLVNVDDVCVIEPSAPCDHCGYCKSHGH